MDTVVTLVTDLRAPVLYALILAIVFAETAVLLGMLLPGETAAIVAGVLASQQQLSLQAVIPLVVVAAIAGDTTGYLLGRRFGPNVLEGRLLRRRHDQVERAAASLRRHGWLVIVVSRFLPFLRTVTPAAAGVSRLPYPAFFAASVAGCVLWGVGCPVLGYLAADSYERVEEVVGNTGIIVLALLALTGWVVRVRRRRRARQVAAPDGSGVSSEPADAPDLPDAHPVATSTPPEAPAAEPQPRDDPATVRPTSPAGTTGSIDVLRPRRRTDRRRP
ncbi:DedA family protein [Cryptosporangium minutisporangium]|uniref:VTT domain-containing protein n=1 Tax=Cryptosporangium minutisporangium TaxID=113569 RepID=A0ABP6SWD7_9ACTN